MSKLSGNAPRGPSAKWPRRGDDNRLEPECWPMLNPSFRLERGARVFTIGSCFARHIEQHLAKIAFRVPALEFLANNAESFGEIGSEVLNKYTPPSIYQELAWTKAIRDRDGVVTVSDIQPSLIRLKSGKLIDLDRRYISKFGIEIAVALDHRQKIYSLFSQAFDCDIIIMTLGNIECWWDNKENRYIEFTPALARENSDNRFQFKKLQFAEAHKYIRDSIELLNSTGAKKILITTSPVPIGGTFTGDDVIVANIYSKSVLRAVAGQVADECPGVDYFPSFENVMLTKQAYVWEDDLIHIKHSFVGKIMLKVLEHYVSDYANSRDGRDNAILIDFINLCHQESYGRAREIYQRIDAVMEKGYTGFQFAAAQLCVHFGETDIARHHLDNAVAAALEDGEDGWYMLWPSARLYEQMQAGGAAEATWSLLFERCKKRPILCRWMVDQSAEWGMTSDMDRIRQFLQETDDPDLEALLHVAFLYQNHQGLAESERLYRRALDREPLNVEVGLRLARMLEAQGRHVDAIAALDGAMGPANRDPAALGVLLRLFRKIDDQPGTQATLRRIVQSQPANYQAHVNLARSLLGDDQLDEAELHARRADELDPSKPIGKNLLTRIATARRALEKAGAARAN